MLGILQIRTVGRLTWLLPVAVLSCAGLCTGLHAAPVSGLPNFIIILADDLGYGDIGPFGSVSNRTPNLDRMAREGMMLRSFYGCPVCTPSRAQFMTGCYAKRVGLPAVIFPACPIGLNRSEATLPGLLQKRGYATMCVGKWHLGDQREFLPTRRGFDHYFGLPYSNDMGGGEDWPQTTKPQSTEARKPALAAPSELGIVQGRRPPLPLVRDQEVIESVSASRQDGLTERYTEEAVRFIRENRGRPFFLYLPHTAVHVPLHPGAGFRGRSKNGTYGDWVEEVDWSVGRVLDVLRELKLDGRTLVLFTSDNGPWLTQGRNGGVAGPLRGGKGTTWEGGVREPTIAWWPGKIEAGTSCDAFAANLDLLPTFVKLAGGVVPADRRIDGADIWPLLSGATRESPHEAHYFFNGNRLEAVRSGPWKLAIYPQNEGKPGDRPITEADAKAHTPRLYDLVADIGETTDVAAEHPDVVNRLLGWVARMDADLGIRGAGPGVRPPGRVAKPQPLLLRGFKAVLDSPDAGSASSG
jgi:arylsulfatase A